MKEWKAAEKEAQKMTRDGAISVNMVTGEASRVSDCAPEQDYSSSGDSTAFVRSAAERLDTIGRDEQKAIKQSIERLEALDNVEPNEALECLECLYCESDDYRSNDRAKDYATIKNYILKAQESKKYLKREDLEFSEELGSIEKKLRALEIIKKHFIVKMREEPELNGNVWGRLVSIQAKEDEGTWATTATANIVDYKEDFDLLKEVLDNE